MAERTREFLRGLRVYKRMRALRAGVGTVRLALAAACVVSSSCSRSPAGARDAGYWSSSCTTGDDALLLAGGDHTALVDLRDGAVRERFPGLVKAVGCHASGGLVVGYTGATQWPSRTPAASMPALGETVLARRADGTWVSVSRRSVGGKWSGPPSMLVSGGAEDRRFELLPRQFGAVGSARALPLPDSFAVRFGSLLRDGRLLLAAGWQPSRSGGQVEDVPWGFFALDLDTGEPAPLTAPIPSDAAVNQALLQRIAATPDGARLLVAAHDGAMLTVAQFERGKGEPVLTSSIPTTGSPSAVAIATDGSFAAVAAETRGRDAPAVVRVLDRAGKTAWTGEFRKNVAGLHFLGDGSLVVAAGEARAVKVALPAGTVAWRTE